jgi:hypothetical protein
MLPVWSQNASLRQCAIIFNKLFEEIATVKNIGQPYDDEPNSDVHGFQVCSMSQPQRDLIISLSIELSRALDVSNTIVEKIGKGNDSTSDPEITLHETIKLQRKTEKQIVALQEYLIQELNFSSDLNEKLQVLETQLVEMTSERNRYLKLYESHRVNGTTLKTVTHSAATTTTTTTTTSAADSDKRIIVPQLKPITAPNHSSYIGRYIRKSFGGTKFFGLLVSYLPPYFKVLTSFCAVN